MPVSGLPLFVVQLYVTTPVEATVAVQASAVTHLVYEAGEVAVIEMLLVVPTRAAHPCVPAVAKVTSGTAVALKSGSSSPSPAVIAAVHALAVVGQLRDAHFHSGAAIARFRHCSNSFNLGDLYKASGE